VENVQSFSPLITKPILHQLTKFQRNRAVHSWVCMSCSALQTQTLL